MVTTSNMSKIKSVRPHQVLSISDDYTDHDDGIRFFMPPVKGGGLSVLESVMLVKLMRCVDPTYIFEFGTYDGATTRLLLENMVEKEVKSERIYTLDLLAIEGVVFQGLDKLLAERATSTTRKYTFSAKKHLVKQLLQDSMKLDPEIYREKFQFIFIDANHELNYVRKDTENARKMITGSRHCIVWHDYGNPQFPELKQYLDDLSSELELYHIGDTKLVFHLAGKNVPAKAVWP